MTVKEKFRERLEGHIADFLLTLGLGAIGAITYFADWLLPSSLIQSLGMLLSAQILLGLLLTTLLLAAWVIYLRTRPRKKEIVVQEKIVEKDPPGPKLRWRTDLGVWEDEVNSLYYCPKCKTNPMANREAGWYCAPCHHLVESPEWKAKLKKEQEEEDRQVREFNESRRI